MGWALEAMKEGKGAVTLGECVNSGAVDGLRELHEKVRLLYSFFAHFSIAISVSADIRVFRILPLALVRLI